MNSVRDPPSFWLSSDHYAGSVSAVKIVLKPRPSVTPHFVGRDDILDKLRETHFSEHPHQGPAISVLSGLGGSGKTQTALKFALEFETRYVYASHPLSLNVNLVLDFPKYPYTFWMRALSQD